MAEELGKIEKLDIEQFGKRKIYVVPLLFRSEEMPQEYKEKLEKYWREVNEQLANQEAKVGKVTRIYHETVSVGGEAGLKIVEQINSLGYLIAKDKCEGSAVFEATELADLADENMDWERCLLMGFFSQKAAATVTEFYHETSKKRYEYIGQHIDETLQKNEVAILFIREGHMVQFAKDIEVFSVAPRSLDEIHRWLRDRSSTETKGDTEKTG